MVNADLCAIIANVATRDAASLPARHADLTGCRKFWNDTTELFDLVMLSRL
jgi:hypothetical protein